MSDPTPSPSLDPRAWTELILLALIWGASFLTIKLALDEVPVFTLVAHRVAWACLVLWAYVWWCGFAMPKDARTWGALLVMGLLNNAIPFTLMAWGQQFIETGLTAIFNAATAVFGVTVAAAIFKDERLTLLRGVGVAVAFLGVAVSIGLDSLARFDLRSLAQLAVLAGAASYALAAAWARARLGPLAPQVAVAGMLTGASLIVLPLALIVDGPPTVPRDPITYAAIGYVAVFGTALAYLLYYRILAAAGSGNTMIVTLLIPPVAILLGWLILDEHLTGHALLGFALLAAGLALMNGRARGARDRGRRAPARPSSGR